MDNSVGGVDTGGSWNLMLNISAVNRVNSLKIRKYNYIICMKSWLVFKKSGSVYLFFYIFLSVKIRVSFADFVVFFNRTIKQDFTIR